MNADEIFKSLVPIASSHPDPDAVMANLDANLEALEVADAGSCLAAVNLCIGLCSQAIEDVDDPNQAMAALTAALSEAASVVMSKWQIELATNTVSPEAIQAGVTQPGLWTPGDEL